MRGLRRAINVALGAVLVGLLAGVADGIGRVLEPRGSWLAVTDWALVLAMGALWWAAGELHTHWCGRCGRLREPPMWSEPDEPEGAGHVPALSVLRTGRLLALLRMDPGSSGRTAKSKPMISVTEPTLLPCRRSHPSSRMLNDLRLLGDSLRSLALAVGFYALRAGAEVSDTPGTPQPSRLVSLTLQATPRN
jgi:hypothetical protein